MTKPAAISSFSTTTRPLLFRNKNKFYATVPAPATIHELLDVAEDRYDIELPFRDLFVWGTNRADVGAIQSAIYIGPTKIDTVPCDLYVFRNEDVDWQILIQQGDKPLPRKLVITTIDEEGHPQYASNMQWNLAPKTIGSLSADTHTPLCPMLYFQGRFYNLLTSPSCPVTQEAIKCPEPLCTLKVLPRRAGDMLTVRFGQLTVEGLSPSKIHSLAGCAQNPSGLCIEG